MPKKTEAETETPVQEEPKTMTESAPATEGALTPVTESAVGEALDLDFQADGAMVQETFSQNDLKLPFIRLLQDLSPETDKKKPEHRVDGAESGMFMNSLTKKLFDGETGFLFIPFAFTRDVTEWKPNRGGLVKSHGTDESGFAQTQRNEKGDDVLPNGNTLLLSLMYYGLLIDTDEQVLEPVVLALSKTAVKHGKAWNTMMATSRAKTPDGKVFTPATFYYVYQITSGVESKGENAWYVPHITKAFPTIELSKHYALINGADVYKQCRDLHKSWKEGRVTAADTTQQAADGVDIPF